MKNASRIQIILVFILLTGTHSFENCTFEITTNSINYTPNGIKPIAKINVKTLEIRNGNLPLITRNTFKQYKNLEKLAVVNSSVAKIDRGAFSDLAHLNEIDLSNNSLKQFAFDDLRSITDVKKIVLSGNMLTNLNGCPFDKLSKLEVSNNQLRYLPKSLRKRRSLQLIAENNPWECNNLSLHGDYQKLFCRSKMIHGPRPVASKQTDEALDCSFENCAYYIVGAAWAGIIIGNLCLVRKFVCPEMHETVDVAVQYEKMEVPS